MLTKINLNKIVFLFILYIISPIIFIGGISNCSFATPITTLNNVTFIRCSPKYDKVIVEGEEFYLYKNYFINAIKYINNVKNFNTWSSNVTTYKNSYYKFDIYNDNNKMEMVLYKFTDENNGNEVIIQIHSKDIRRFLKKYDH